MREMKKICKTLVGKPEGKRPFEIPTRRWKNIIIRSLHEVHEMESYRASLVCLLNRFG
jgi:hypothetical protein